MGNPAATDENTGLTVAEMAQGIADTVVDRHATNESYLAWINTLDANTQRGLSLVDGILQRLRQGMSGNAVEIIATANGSDIRDRVAALYRQITD